jgi:diaminohydroxyphosphoribosylaminopyrimidine deaminase/5-amino-6-(5-phosphoribosylamino)uracil reductase
LRFGANNAVSINSVLKPQERSCTVVLFLDENKADIPANDVDASFVLKDFIQIKECDATHLPEETSRLIKTYAPYCFAPLHAHLYKRTFTVGHLAQSLDSRIATLSGDSKWIGSPDNLVHAHRMRALCDGVLIGARTLKRDNSRLTVRHVQGKNPTRLVIGSSTHSLQSLLDASSDPVILIGADQDSDHANVQTIAMSRVNGRMATSDILHELYKRGIFSVYIEGGSITISQFLKENNIDVLQVYISPMMIGKGVDSFILPPVETIADAYRFETWQYARQDEGVMFVGTMAQSE